MKCVVCFWSYMAAIPRNLCECKHTLDTAQVCFLGPELGPLESLLVAPEGGDWYLEEANVSSSRTGHSDRCAIVMAGRSTLIRLCRAALILPYKARASYRKPSVTNAARYPMRLAPTGRVLVGSNKVFSASFNLLEPSLPTVACGTQCSTFDQSGHRSQRVVLRT